jgi:acetyltransferase
MISRTRVARLLAGYRDRQPAELRDVAAALVALSDLVLDFPEIAELDINPLLADSDGVVALDARIIVRTVRPDAPQSAIRPFPAELSHRVAAAGGGFLVRPIKPEDSSALVRMARGTDPEHLRLRFHGAISATSEARAARLSQIDYDREMALVAEMPDTTFGGVIRLVFDPNFEEAECAIIVRSDLQDHGIASTLLADALAYARSRGARRVWGDVMTGNTSTLSLAQHLGARVGPSPADGGLVRVEFALDALGR